MEDEAGLEDDVIYIEPETNIKTFWKKMFIRIPIFKEGWLDKKQASNENLIQIMA